MVYTWLYFSPMNELSPKDFNLLEKKSRLDSVSWFLVMVALVCVAAAILFIFLNQIRYRDFSINGHALGLRLLYAAILFYVGGRGIAYYQRFNKKSTG